MIPQPLNASFAEDIKKSFAAQAMMQLIGAELSRIEPGVVEIELPYRTELTQQNGYVHAGIVTAIADTACGYDHVLVASMLGTMFCIRNIANDI